jgi:glycosyltransferase involved in cell wall biosynthesis
MTRKRTVAVIGTRGYPSYYGGFETATRKLVPYLVESGWEVTVYCRRDQVAVMREDGVRQVFTPGVDSRRLSTLSFGLTAVLHAVFRRPDVALVMNCANGFWIPLLRLRRIPVVVNVDGLEWERDKWGRVARRVFLWGAILCARWAQTLVYDSRAIKQYWAERFDRDGEFIPYGGDDLEPGLLCEAFEPQSYVLLVARFVPENSVGEFLEAVPRLAEHVAVVLVGGAQDGPLEQQAQNLAASHENVWWLGHISDDRRLHALWHHSRVYFHGHSVGGTNPALVQAMALGCTVVARDTVYNREVLSDAGCFTAPTATAIVESVLQVCAAGGDRQSQRARQRAREFYAWPVVCADYERVLSAASRR